MKSLLKKITLTAAFIGFIAAPVMAVTTPFAADAKANCDNSLLGIPPWYRGMTEGPDCNIKSPESFGGVGPFIWRIVLNVVEMALAVTAYIAAFFILYGGFLFMTLGSSPDGVAKARKTILNAVIGLVIAMSAIALTNLVFRIIS